LLSQQLIQEETFIISKRILDFLKKYYNLNEVLSSIRYQLREENKPTLPHNEEEVIHDLNFLLSGEQITKTYNQFVETLLSEYKMMCFKAKYYCKRDFYS